MVYIRIGLILLRGNMLKIFIGWDSREEYAFKVCEASILRRTSIDVEIIPIIRSNLINDGIYTRGFANFGTTQFTFTRFFVPYLSNYSGNAVFCDCDFIWTCDAKDVLDLFDPNYAVQVVKHNYAPTELTKGTGLQHNYPKKNWSSMVLWNNEHPANMILTPPFLNKANASTLHQFKWLNDSQVGSVSHEYNWLEGWYSEPKDGSPKLVHLTRGGPWFSDCKNVEYADLWRQEFKEMSGYEWDDDMCIELEKT